MYEWNTWQMYSEKFAEFHIALHNLSRCREFNDHNIKWYWPYPITSFYELKMIANFRPSYVELGPPLSFDLEKVKAALRQTCPPYDIPMRMKVNNAKPDYLPTMPELAHNICGQWVRPEDAAAYGAHIRCFEFENVDLKQEEVMLHVYKENQEWPGNLNLLLQNLNFNVDNRAIPEEIGEARMNCGQRCWAGSGCQLCVRGFTFAEQIRKEKLRRAESANIDKN